MTTRLWTPADLAEGAVVWVVGDDERHVMDGDTFAIVHNRVGAPLAPYVATLASDRFGVGALNGRRVLSSSAAHVGSLTALGTRRAGIDAPGVTVVALQRQRETGSFREIVQVRWGNNSLWWNNASLQFYGLRAQTSDAASSASLSNVADGAWHLITATADWDGRRGELRLDGGRHVSTQPAATNSGRPVDASCHELLVGTAVGPTYRNDAQDIAELIVFARALDDDEVARVEGYLAHRWGLTASLPETHAYKRVAPKVELADAPSLQPTSAEDPFGADEGTLLLAATTDGDWDLAPHASGQGLALDPTLATMVACSLFCDALVDADEAQRAGSSTRRGYWADAYSDTGDTWGSKLWLLDRAKPTQATARAWEAHAKEALDWMIEAGLAESIETAAVVVSALEGASIDLTVRITRPAHLVPRFHAVWEATFHAL